MSFITRARIPLAIISYGPLVREWCKLEYPNHTEGCQNEGDKNWCPPKVQAFPEMVSTERYNIIRGHSGEMFLLKLKPGELPTMWLFLRRFDLKAYAEALQKRHPSRTDAQARIPYLWHGKVYDAVYADAERFRWYLKNPSVLIRRPEANGVNLFATCRVNGGPQLEKNPQDIVYLMAMVCEAC